MVASATVGVKQQKRKRAQAEIGEETQAPQMAVVREDTPADAVQDEGAHEPTRRLPALADTNRECL